MTSLQQIDTRSPAGPVLGGAPAAARAKPARATLTPLNIALLLLLFYLVAVPLALLLVASFSPTGLPLDPGWGLVHFADVYGDPGFYRLVGNTVVFAIGCTLGALSVGGLLAWLVERTDLPFKGTA
ncbi:MAG: hypothetical protein KDH48_21310, partial [Rhodoferax sp.]|nr:hypothetical protein [Rhodoferax sp.]